MMGDGAFLARRFLEKRPEHLKAIAREQSRASWDYADALCAVLPGVVHELREDGKLSMDELQLRSQVQRETTSTLEAEKRLLGFFTIARMAFVLGGGLGELVRRLEAARAKMREIRLASIPL